MLRAPPSIAEKSIVTANSVLDPICFDTGLSWRCQNGICRLYCGIWRWTGGTRPRSTNPGGTGSVVPMNGAYSNGKICPFPGKIRGIVRIIVQIFVPFGPEPLCSVPIQWFLDGHLIINCHKRGV